MTKVIFKKNLKPNEISIIYAIITFLPFLAVLLTNFGLLNLNINTLSYYILITFLFLITVLNIITKKPYLSLIFGCHNLCERSFKFKRFYFPICSRCTGIYIGIYLSLLKLIFDYHFIISILFMIPLILDGLIQNFSKYTSNNLKRIFSGVLFGIGSIEFFLLIVYTNEKLIELIKLLV